MHVYKEAQQVITIIENRGTCQGEISQFGVYRTVDDAVKDFDVFARENLDMLDDEPGEPEPISISHSMLDDEPGEQEQIVYTKETLLRMLKDDNFEELTVMLYTWEFIFTIKTLPDSE